MNIGDVLATPLKEADGSLAKDDAGNVITVKGSYYLKVNLPDGVESITLRKGETVNLRTPQVFFNNIIENTKSEEVRKRAQEQLSKTPSFVQLKADIRTKK